MIILKHLTVERFRLLREINLDFPQRGSILIHGPNEAGKSALLESIYFALYGESLVSELKRNPGAVLAAGSLGSSFARLSLDDLVLYGERQASVTLTLSIGATELTITRTIERGRGQSVSLYVRRLGMPEGNPITRLGEANERVIAELGRMDGEALRNSCLIEQKGLNRLEYLSGSQREATLRKLLGLEKLVPLSEQFKLTEHDEQLLSEASLRLKLAEVQARIPELSMQLGQLEAALDAVTVTEDLAEIDQQEAEIAEQAISLEQLSEKRNAIKGRQSRISQLKKADSILGEIIGAYDAIAEAQHELPELERQVAELERRERDELPTLENRVHDLSELTRSFGTLERMATDLLVAVNTIKALEQELKEHQAIQGNLAELDEQIIHARLQVEQARQSQHELEERSRVGRPQLEARLHRLQSLTERLNALHEAQERYTRHIQHRGLAQENSVQLKKVQQELQETEQELALVENEATQLQQEADAIENHWRQLSIGRQLEEWQRLKGLSQGLTDAEQHVMAAHQQQEQLTLLALAARRAVTKNMGVAIVCIVLFLLCGSAALILALRQVYVYSTIAGMASLLLAAGAGLSLQNSSKSREEEKVADRQMQDAISRVGMMVAAREAASRIAGGDMLSGAKSHHDALAQAEHELRSLGSAVPRSIEEAQYLLQHLPDRAEKPGESLANIQQRMADSRNNALAARNQVNVTMEAIAALRKERTRLQEERTREGWDNLDEQLLTEQPALQQMRHEIASSVGQEGLPLPTFAASTADVTPGPGDSLGTDQQRQGDDEDVPTRIDASSLHDSFAQLKTQIEDAIKATEREIAALDGKMDLLPDLTAQVDIYQQALDVLLARKQAVLERGERFQTTNPEQQIESARQQQDALREALRNLQDSLRQRVQQLGVSFGQAAIGSTEAAARQQLETLQITLGQRIELQNRHATYAALLKERQDALSEHYQQLAKLSGALGSWIVPPNPFAESLVALRARCQQEMQEADEEATLSELEALEIHEGASQAKIALCHAEIEAAHERIATMLAQCSRPPAKGYSLRDIVAVWPLVGEHSPEDRERLQTEHAVIEQELHELEQQELAMSEQLHIGATKIDLAQARKFMQQQERTYHTKKHASLLLQALDHRLMQRMLPRIEYYLQQLLPPLTSGRFHDARLTTDLPDQVPEGAEVELSGGRPLVDPFEPVPGAWQLSVWEAAAHNYIPSSGLSAGTADQLSLALRLAFAIAALPRELSAAPGFLLLDEPLGASDQQRARALVEIVTGHMLSQHFEQVVLISNSSACDPAMFAYHLSIDAGRVVESNLPIAPSRAAELPTAREAAPSPDGAVLSAVSYL